MRLIPFVISTVVSAGLVIALNKKWGSVPPMGKFLSPQHGFWQNAEAADYDFNEDLKFASLNGKTAVYFDERLVPHIFADNDNDAYFVQGYLHAKFRLWQMEFQTLATAGRISEVIGEKAINYDREQRRMGLTYGAENMAKAFEENENTREAVKSYTAGINSFIENMKESELPIEYKLLDYKPEKWSTLKTALFIKQMTKTLAGYGYANDFQYSDLHTIFSEAEMKMLFPYAQDSLNPIIPKGTPYPLPSVSAIAPPNSDSVYLHKKDSLEINKTDKPTPGVGSNNWAVSGIKTQSGFPILCNDPHLDLTVPAIWYELQMNTPSFNAYGTSFPGIPGVVIGFNDSVAFGFTNGGIDVMDFYEIKFKDDSKQQYLHKGQWTDSKLRIEEIKVRGGNTVYDTVAYSVFGPVMYDKSFTNVSSEGKAVAIRWKAHDPSNELLMWWQLNRAKNYDDYAAAIKYFTCPVQNIVFACKRGDIALWQQGEIPLRWPEQGKYIMPGEDDSYSWQGMIPQEENPHSVNPERGFVSSANQLATDSTYPYFVPGDYAVYRGYAINKRLSSMQQITPKDMMELQNNNFNTKAEIVRPFLLTHIDETKLNSDEKRLLDLFKTWNLENNPEEKGPAIFDVWMDSLEKQVWHDEFAKAKDPIYPHESTLIDGLLKDSLFQYADDINTPQKETAVDVITASFKLAAPFLLSKEKENKLGWAEFKNTTIYHLLRTNALPFAVTGIKNGGGKEIINATSHSNGPSWRMIVHLSPVTEAYGVYPGGQSGNPGSRYYDNFVDTWAKGEYYRLWVMKKSDAIDKRVKWTMKFSKG
ncbi:penicillin acylase family protein [Terrimonas pollutisoli]|uniref:penicillin acylase family protein n=1 Tax=Terrimonas pollutisoli TaxID=3034147 RepID=UPI0023EC372F|nr:penicillin acylase family protein [Terrimonas sp. H1YJ31]